MSAPVVGQAYRGADGIVRWVTGKSRRGLYRCLWLNEGEGIWHSGSAYKADAFPLGDPFLPPEPGESYLRAGPLGSVRVFRVPAEDVVE